MNNATPYSDLSPDDVLDAVAAIGYVPDGRLLSLNSFENRVYQVGIEEAPALVVKFYRPGRWSDAAIGEEHAFALELVDAELPVVAPLIHDGVSLFRHGNHRFALYPRRGGHAPSLESAENLIWMGRLLARLHTIGARRHFAHRESITVETLLRPSIATVLRSPLLPPMLASRYRTATDALDITLRERFAMVEPYTRLRLHGDCHAGNVLWTDAGPHFVDLDDARTGPAVQDLWMLAPDRAALDALLEGYVELRDFAFAELALIEPLRLLRQVHWAGWIAARWHDPAFPAAFPYVGEARWWEQHTDDLLRGTDHLSG